MSKRLWIPLGVTAVCALAYASTIMFSFNGGDSPYTDDTGEFQLALSLWGTAHPTGYPLYLFLGSPFVALLRLLGVSAALASSLFSLGWALGAVVGVILIGRRLTQHEWLAGALGLVFALTRSIWVHASMAEVYSFNMALMVGLLWLTLDLLERWDDQRGWALALLGGLSVAHHRLLAVGLPVIGLMLLPSALGHPPSAKKLWRWLLISIPAFALGFLPYLDIMRRIVSGSTWIYGRTDSWAQVWDIFIATEYSGLQRPNLDLAVLAQNLWEVLGVLAHELTWPGLGVAVLGTFVALLAPRTRKYGLLLGGSALSYLLFTVLLRQAVMIEANLMFVSLTLLCGLAVGLGSMLNHEDTKNTKFFLLSLRVLQFFVVFSLVVWSATLFIVHRDSVLRLTRNPQSLDYVTQAERLDAPPGSYLMAPWGWRYFALVYAHRIEGRLKNFTIIDHNADYAGLAKTVDSVYTAYDTFFIFTERDFWREQWGQVYLSSAAPNIVRISRTPLLREAATSFIPMGDNIGLIDVEVRPIDTVGGTDVVVRWTATAKPTRDYSTFVHFSDAEQIASDDDIVVKHDEAAPVYAWRATTTWVPNEIVREDHVVKLPGDRPAKLIVVGMYYRNEAGEFVNLQRVEVRLKNGVWQITNSK